jgi:hypothetical protein
MVTIFQKWEVGPKAVSDLREPQVMMMGLCKRVLCNLSPSDEGIIFVSNGWYFI